MPLPATILVVDDHEDALEATAWVLERGGYRVSRASDGRQALDLTRKLHPAVILLDVMLPDISGLDVLEQIRADPDLTGSSVILFSARATGPQQQAGGLNAGADGYIAKPIAPAELLARVRAEVRHRELTEALRASEARYRDLVETSHDLIWAVDADGRLTFLNHACRMMFGRDPEQMLGRHFSDFVPDDPGTREAEMCAEALPYGIDTVGHTSRMYARDGREVVLSTNARVVRDAEGRVVGTTGISRDITGQQHALQAVRTSEERFRLLSKATSDAIWDWDLVTNTLWWNEGFETLLGYTQGEAAPTIDSWSDRIHPDDKDVVIAGIHAAMASGQAAWTRDYRVVRKGGSELHVHNNGHIIRGQEGTPIRMIGGMTDVTERMRLERHFLRAQRLQSLGTLAGGIAHDLNNALAPVLMAIEIVKADEQDPAKLDTLAILESSARRCSDMVRQVMSFAGGTEGRRAIIDVLTVVREVERIVSETFPKNVDFALKVEAQPWPISADATQLHQVLLNLCVNARDAMPRGGRVTLEVSNLNIDESYASMHPEAGPGPYVVLRLADLGTGMPPEVMDRIFEPFYTTKELGRGTGLGLATAHAIVQGHGGFIHAHSEMGRGTTFTVYLPAEASGMAVEHIGLAWAELPLGQGEVILVVDDEPRIRRIAEKTLTRFGYRVRLAGNGAEAVSAYALHQQEIAVVLTDMMMPVMDGHALVVALKAMNPAVRIIGSSGLDADGLVAKAMAAGVESFLPKPYSAEALLKMLAAILGRAS